MRTDDFGWNPMRNRLMSRLPSWRPTQKNFSSRRGVFVPFQLTVRCCVPRMHNYQTPYLVGGIPTPLKNMSSSVRIIIPNWIWKVINFHGSSHHQPDIVSDMWNHQKSSVLTTKNIHADLPLVVGSGQHVITYMFIFSRYNHPGVDSEYGMMNIWIVNKHSPILVRIIFETSI